MSNEKLSKRRLPQEDPGPYPFQSVSLFSQSPLFHVNPAGRLRESKKETQPVGPPGPPASPTCCARPGGSCIYTLQSCYCLNVTSLLPLLLQLAARQPLPGRTPGGVHVTSSPSERVHAHVPVGEPPQRLVDLSLPPTAGRAVLLLKPSRCLTGRHAPPDQGLLHAPLRKVTKQARATRGWAPDLLRATQRPSVTTRLKAEPLGITYASRER